METHWRPRDAYEAQEQAKVKDRQHKVADVVLSVISETGLPRNNRFNVLFTQLDREGGTAVSPHYGAKAELIEVFGSKTYEVYAAWKNKPNC